MSRKIAHQAGNERPVVLYHGKQDNNDHDLQVAANACDCCAIQWGVRQLSRPKHSQPVRQAHVTFLNHRRDDHPVYLFWISYERGVHVPYGRLYPGERMDILTQTTHVWSVETCDYPIQMSERNTIRGGNDRFAVWKMWEQLCEQVSVGIPRYYPPEFPSPRDLEYDQGLMERQFTAPYYIPNGNLPTPDQELQPMQPEDEPIPCSDTTLPDVRMVVINSRDAPVHLYWRNHIRQRVSYGTVPPGGTRVTLRTYAGYPWLILDEQSSRVLGIWCPTDVDGLVMLMDNDETEV